MDDKAIHRLMLTAHALTGLLAAHSHPESNGYPEPERAAMDAVKFADAALDELAVQPPAGGK